ncbi:MAG: hypothetical protein KTR32_33425 [Granulosicoccus sp.]|nr:hypothetical protein [Granulosicoccus sp.]
MIQPADTMQNDDAEAQIPVPGPSDCVARGRLSIVSGAQSGAVSQIRELLPISIGSKLDNDVVLRSGSVDPQHVSVCLRGAMIELQCLGSSLLVDGTSLSSGEQCQALHRSMLQIGDVSIMIESSTAQTQGQATSPDWVNAAARIGGDSDNAANQIGLHTGPHSEAMPASFLAQTGGELPALSDAAGEFQTSTDSVTNNAAGKPSSRYKAAVLTAAALSLCAVVVWQSGLFKQETEAPASLAKLLSTTAFAGLNVTQEGHSATVSGYVESVHDSIELGKWLKQSGLLINNEVVVVETLADRVSDVFRVNGIDATVAVSESGAVSAITQVADEQLLARVKEQVETDVPGVAPIKIENTPPPLSEQAETNPIPVDPGKRVALVVSDEPAYIVTEDQSRYFIGSLLPTGYRIVDIKDGKVTLEMEGETETLEF